MLILSPIGLFVSLFRAQDHDFEVADGYTDRYNSVVDDTDKKRKYHEQEGEFETDSKGDNYLAEGRGEFSLFTAKTYNPPNTFKY